MIGFGFCFGAGYLISFASFTFFVELLEGNPLPFVYVYTIGNILALSSSMFLVGPKRQFKNMFDDKRKWTTITYLTCLVLTLIICFVPGMDDLTRLLILVLLLFVQFFASLWYSLSYIPFARKAVINFFKDAAVWAMVITRYYSMRGGMQWLVFRWQLIFDPTICSWLMHIMKTYLSSLYQVLYYFYISYTLLSRTQY